MQDVTIIGGSFSGMAAALQLLRARRTVHIIDAGLRRNRFTDHSYGFLGQDGASPAVIWTTARAQLNAYPTLTWTDGTAISAQGEKDGFVVTTDSGASIAARRILMATGLKDNLPNVAGMAARWGKSVHHCPYCHGYELDMGHIGVIATGPMSAHQAMFIPEWGTVTFFTNMAITLDDTMRADLKRRNVRIEETPIAQITGKADVQLQDGRIINLVGLFTAAACAPASTVAQDMGCIIVQTPMGTQIETSDTKETNISGVFACGDVARVPHTLSLAVADGAWAGAQIHRSLVWP